MLLRSKRRLIYGNKTTPAPLPDDLWLEIIARLPGKPVARCRCVCNRWRSMIRSRPFQEAYRERQRGLLIYWSSINNWVDRKLTHRLQFFHCPLRRRNEPPENFSLLQKLDLQAESLEGPSGLYSPVYLTQSVEGLVCVGNKDGSHGDDSKLRLSLLNISTGETIEIPDPLPREHVYSRYHLGYDRESREYKLLRLMIGESILGAHVMTLRSPSGSMPMTWKALDNDAAGITGLLNIGYGGVLEARTCSSDGLLCWIYLKSLEVRLHDSLLCYDFSSEKFRFIGLPHDGIFRNFLTVTRFNDRLALWLELEEDEKKVRHCYVLDDEGKNWSRQSVSISKHFEEERGSVVASGKLLGSSSSSSNSEMLVMSSHLVERRRVHYYVDKDGDDVFYVGQLPDEVPKFHGRFLFHQWQSYFRTYQHEVFCLLECNNLYLSLDHILAPASASVE